MMRLPALTVEERAFFVGTRIEPSLLDSLAERVRCRLTACLGVPVQVIDSCVMHNNTEHARLMRIVPNPEMKSAWITARFGGKAASGDRPASSSLVASLDRVLALAMAESVVNRGHQQEWPASIGVALNIQNVRCEVHFLSEPETLMNWAEAELERTT